VFFHTDMQTTGRPRGDVHSTMTFVWWLFIMFSIGFGAMLAAAACTVPAAVLAHSPPGALLRSDRIRSRRVPSTAERRPAAAGLGSVDPLDDCWRGMPILCTSIRELDPSAVRDANLRECVIRQFIAGLGRTRRDARMLSPTLDRHYERPRVDIQPAFVQLGIAA
jgi:hypothetical protein